MPAVSLPSSRFLRRALAKRTVDGEVVLDRQQLKGREVSPLDKNHGALARNLGVRATQAPYVAFSDDDSWWQAGSLGRAASIR